MNKNVLMGAMIASMMIVGCGGGSDTKNEPTKDERFSTMVTGGDTLRIDSMTKLEWIGSEGNGACQPHGAATTESEDIAGAVAHCSSLSFAGHSDWRVATAAEHATFITGMSDAGIIPFYANPACPRLIGSDGTTAIAVNTHNSSPVGAMAPWATLLMQSATNYGVKCVR
jgi:hypothetical protein